MPELPEVETVRQTLRSSVLGKKVAGFRFFSSSVYGKADPASFLALKGKTIAEVARKGKMLAFLFDEDYVLTSHLRMEGKYFYQQIPAEQGKHDAFRIDFTDGSALVYNDVRKFGRIALYPYSAYQDGSCYEGLGKEPFDMTPKELYSALRRLARPIKECLMDQRLIAGIGNIYADETLFEAKIHPLTPAKSIPLSQCEALLRHCRAIMNTAIEEGGSTVRSYHPSDGIDGRMQLHLLAYGQEGKPCPCCGFPMNKIFVHGRGTTYCPLCQNNPTRPFVLGVTGPIHSGKSTASRYFESRGYLRFDADQVAKESYGNKEIKKQVQALFGKKSYAKGRLDAAYLRAVLAKNPKKKKALEAIIHPYVAKKAEEFIRKAKHSDKVVLDVPLLFPSGMDSLCDATILVEAPLELRVKRIEEEGRDAASLKAINASYPLSSAEKKARFVVTNEARVEDLYAKLEALPLP